MKLPEVFRQALALALCCFLLTIPASVAQADTKVIGTVQFQGNVLINGAGSPSNATLFSGDTISVPAGAPALLTTADGARIELRPNSEARFVAGATGTEVLLKQGAVRVQTAQPGQAAVLIEGLLARSLEKAPTLFEVARQDKKVDVTSGRGNVEISGLVGGPITVAAGKRATLEARPKSTGKDQPPATGAGSDAYAGIPEWGWVLIILGATAGLVGGILAATGDESPSRP